MTSEFKKFISKTETRYVLESASAGGTSSGAVSSVSSPLGKVRKRSDNILAQETDDPCWKNYKQLGTKKKNGKTVPNCVPKESVEESAPPGFPEDLMMKLKKQYPGNPERAFATAWSIHKKKKKAVKEDSLDNLQKEFDFVYHPKRYQLYVYPKGADTSDIYSNAIAWIGLDYAGKGPNGEPLFASSDTMVQPKYRKRGIATAMYQYLRQQGINIVSSNEQTPQGSSMWKSFRAKGLASGDKFLEDPYFEELATALEAKLKPNDPVDVWKQDFQTADPNKYHQFKNKTPEKKDQMAISAHYKSRQPIATKK